MRGRGTYLGATTVLLLIATTGTARATPALLQDATRIDGECTGAYAYDHFGSPLAGGGDVNGDGYNDLWLCAWGNDEGGDSTGQAYLFFGGPVGWGATLVASAADASFWGVPDVGLCSAAAVVSDMNGDTLDELAVSDSYGGVDGLVWIEPS